MSPTHEPSEPDTDVFVWLGVFVVGLIIAAIIVTEFVGRWGPVIDALTNTH